MKAPLPSLLAAGLLLSIATGSELAPSEPLPTRLSETGLYDDDGLADDVLAFSPQYPLWTDGATKRRWIRLPPGTVIDASDADAWDFPVGTQLWKEFSFGRRVETRYLARAADGTWRYGTYLWNADGTDATLVPRGAVVDLGDGRKHDVPPVGDCAICHDNGGSPVLGFAALQLSADRDPGAPHGEPFAAGEVDLRELVRRGLIVGVDDVAPRIEGRTPTERAARGYLHGNCGGCHDAEGALASVGMDLRASVGGDSAAIDTTVGRPSRAALPGDPSAPRIRIVPGVPDASVLLGRMRSRSPVHQMPPLGTRVVDDEAVAVITRWIAELDSP